MRSPRNITVRISNTGANKTQTKQKKGSMSLKRPERSNCQSSFQQYTPCNILSTGMLFRRGHPNIWREGGEMKRQQNNGLWICVMAVHLTPPALCSGRVPRLSAPPSLPRPQPSLPPTHPQLVPSPGGDLDPMSPQTPFLSSPPPFPFPTCVFSVL